MHALGNERVWNVILHARTRARAVNLTLCKVISEGNCIITHPFKNTFLALFYKHLEYMMTICLMKIRGQ